MANLVCKHKLFIKTTRMFFELILHNIMYLLTSNMKLGISVTMCNIIVANLLSEQHNVSL